MLHRKTMHSVPREKGKKMADLIDRQELLKHKGNCYDEEGHLLYAVGTGTILLMPTVDAEPVVRCKDCKHWHESVCLRGEQGQKVGMCDCTMSMRDTDFFCKAGEKETEDG